MDELALQAQTDAARAYESLLVPALFGQWAARVAELAMLKPGQRALDVACGTGVLAREAHARTNPNGYVAGLDPGVGMLAVARELEPGIDWREGSAEAIPFADESFDAVVSQFGMMFFPDAVAALREMTRVLKPGGTLVVAVWDRLERAPGFAAEVDLLERMAGTAAADALRAPFVLGDAEAMATLGRAAGVDAVVVREEQGQARFPSIRSMVEADLRGWLPVMGVNLSEGRIGEVLEEAESALAAFVQPAGVIFDAPALILTGRKRMVSP